MTAKLCGMLEVVSVEGLGSQGFGGECDDSFRGCMVHMSYSLNSLKGVI